MKKVILFTLLVLGFYFDVLGKNKNSLTRNYVDSFMSVEYKGYNFPSSKQSLLHGTGSEKNRYIILGKCWTIDSSKKYPIHNSGIRNLRKVKVEEKSYFCKIEYKNNAYRKIYFSNNENEDMEDYEVDFGSSYFYDGRTELPKKYYAWISDDPDYPMQITDEIVNDEQEISIGNNSSREEEMQNIIDSIKQSEIEIERRKQFVLDSIQAEKQRLMDSIDLLNDRIATYTSLMNQKRWLEAINIIDLVIMNNNYLPAFNARKQCIYGYNTLFSDSINNKIRCGRWSEAIEFSKSYKSWLFSDSFLVTNNMTTENLCNRYFSSVLSRCIGDDKTVISTKLDSIKVYYSSVNNGNKSEYDRLRLHCFNIWCDSMYSQSNKAYNNDKLDKADSLLAYILLENNKWNSDMSKINILQTNILEKRFKKARKDMLSNRTGGWCIQPGFNLVSNFMLPNTNTNTNTNINYFNPNLSLGLYRKYGIHKKSNSINGNERWVYNTIGIKASITDLTRYLRTSDLELYNTGYYSDLMLNFTILRTFTFGAGIANEKRRVLSYGIRISWLNLESKMIFNSNSNLTENMFVVQAGIQPNISFGKRLRKTDIQTIKNSTKYDQEHILEYKYNQSYSRKPLKMNIKWADIDNGVTIGSIFSGLSFGLAAISQYNYSQTALAEYESMGSNIPDNQKAMKYAEYQRYQTRFTNYIICTSSVIVFDIVYGIIRHEIKKRQQY